MPVELERPSRRTIGWGLLFGLPPGFGVTGYVASLTGSPFSAVALGWGLFTAVAVFTFVVVLASTGSPDPSFETRDDGD